MPTAIFHGSSGELRELLRRVPSIFAGTAPDPIGIAQGLQLRLGVALLSKIQGDFITKGRGGTGEDGIRWQPLKRETIIGRRRSAADKKSVRISSRLTDQLTPAERRALTRKIEKEVRNREALLRARFGLTDGQAKGLARAQAEKALRQGGKAKAIGDILGAREVDILRDTSKLFRSFSPGIEDRSPVADEIGVPQGPNGEGNDQQVFETPPGRVIVGTNEKTWHHKGNKNLPARPFWPPDGRLPLAWWSFLIGVAQRGVVRGVVLLVSGRAA